MIANAGIRRIVFGEFYRDERIFEYANKLDIALVGLGEAAVPRRKLKLRLLLRSPFGAPAWRPRAGWTSLLCSRRPAGRSCWSGSSGRAGARARAPDGPARPRPRCYGLRHPSPRSGLRRPGRRFQPAACLRPSRNASSGMSANASGSSTSAPEAEQPPPSRLHLLRRRHARVRGDDGRRGRVAAAPVAVRGLRRAGDVAAGVVLAGAVEADQELLAALGAHAGRARGAGVGDALAPVAVLADGAGAGAGVLAGAIAAELAAGAGHRGAGVGHALAQFSRYLPEA
jgi:hypothetical protein